MIYSDSSETNKKRETPKKELKISHEVNLCEI